MPAHLATGLTAVFLQVVAAAPPLVPWSALLRSTPPAKAGESGRMPAAPLLHQEYPATSGRTIDGCGPTEHGGRSSLHSGGVTLTH